MAVVERASLELQHEVEQFYYQEAALLDERRFDEWLGLFTEELSYRMPVRTLRYQQERGQELGADGDVAHFDDDRYHLTMRVTRLMTGVAWADEPATRSRHLVSNVRVQPQGEELHVRSSFLVHHSRGEHEAQLYAGERHDVLKRVEGALRIARRTITIDQTILPSNLGVFL